MLIEAVQNHTPHVLVVDEIGTTQVRDLPPPPTPSRHPSHTGGPACMTASLWLQASSAYQHSTPLFAPPMIRLPLA